MTNLIEHAKHELTLAGTEDTLYKEALPKAVLELIDVFANQGHSGMSAGITIDLFTRLAKFQPLTPLTGTDNEWTEIEDGLFQNKRASHVFKENGEAYDIEGRIFEDENGCRYINKDSRVAVTFPYIPKREYVKR